MLVLCCVSRRALGSRRRSPGAKRPWGRAARCRGARGPTAAPGTPPPPSIRKAGWKGKEGPGPDAGEPGLVVHGAEEGAVRVGLRLHTHTHTHTWRLLAVNGLSRGCSDERKATLQVKAVPHLSPAHRRQGDRTGRRSASAYALRGTLPFLALSLPFCQRLTPLLVVLPQEHYGFSCDCGRCKKELRQKLKHRSR